MNIALILVLTPGIFTAVGDILIGLAVFKVHEKLEVEMKVDKEVIREMHIEKKLVTAGIIFILPGLLLDSLYIFKNFSN